ncbi:RicAFT regulatory complex protein RicA family protein [Alkalicoccobacillus plakortidis]|uniref:RicAFT regulatory complex protein RicA family protein n=1 Tax=Alkalicoccobacillus plakortidis TaxID=444060 RepID=A0ABT0XFI9_9BACI|nr:RicAFT regulatory complex protein RicA family protein [Alkalicoccobacillus plakortidis]MCM2674666.1 RicAFT regulatory complex protein RicA family protein [Alkalicoccobacillus plakortidis]
MNKLYTKDDVRQKARELAKMVAETEEVDFYKRAEKQVNDHLRIQELIAQIKKEQKEAVNLKHYGKTEALKAVDARIDALHEEIDEIPLVQEFKRSQVEVNYLLQMISNTISKTVTDEIIISTDGDLLKGRTVKSPF